jgi:hypothetical protein
MQFGVVAHCTAPGQCSDLAVGCDARSCPAGSLCCVSVQGEDIPLGPEGAEYDGGHVTGSTQCVQGATCPVGTQPACDQRTLDCPSTQMCAGFFVGRCIPLPGADAGGGG